MVVQLIVGFGYDASVMITQLSQTVEHKDYIYSIACEV